MSFFTAAVLGVSGGLAPVRAGASVLMLNPAWGRQVAQCTPVKGQAPASHVWIFKQWHLAPHVDTHASRAVQMPQQENQTAIYEQLERWIQSSSLMTVFAEGCSGIIDGGFQPAFNGWNFKDLQPLTAKPEYAGIVTHIPLKLEAKYGDRLRTLCADDEALLQSQNKAFSDARGVVGFYSRLDQFKSDPTRAKPYLTGVIEVYHLSPQTTLPQALARLKQELSGAVHRIDRDLEARNQHFAAAIAVAKVSEAALVIGGAHAGGLVKLLSARGIGCTVVEPAGYHDDAEVLLSQLRELTY